MEGIFAKEFKEQAILRIGENRNRIQKCLAELTEEEIWKRPNPSSNSVGNLVLHLIGNITQWIQSGLVGSPDGRVRDEEFSAVGGPTRDFLAQRILTTVEEAVQSIQGTEDGDLLKVQTVQGFGFSGIGIIIHVTEHLSYHTGQIAFWTKLLKDEDLGFYKGVDLNRRSGS